jgi:two-component system NarL family sensor kinase
MIGTMRDEMKEALAELRRTVSALRAPISDELPLQAMLANLSRTFQQDTGILTHLSIPDGFPYLPETHRLAVYRAAQEGLTNIQRHAAAHNAWLRLSAEDRQISLVMEDDGKGFADQTQSNPGAGLVGLKERAVQLGGELRLSERPGGGAQLTFCFPLLEERAHS